MTAARCVLWVRPWLHMFVALGLSLLTHTHTHTHITLTPLRRLASLPMTSRTMRMCTVCSERWDTAKDGGGVYRCVVLGLPVCARTLQMIVHTCHLYATGNLLFDSRIHIIPTGLPVNKYNGKKLP